MSFRTSFLEWATQRFPDLQQELMGESRQMRMHLAFLRLHRETQAAIDGHRTKELQEFFQMADRVIANSFPEMKSLFHVVYVEHLRFEDGAHDRSWALELLTPRLKSEFVRSLGCCPQLRNLLQ
ncbi:DUF7674 family protein [Pirellulaceae bacterium SH501]